MRKVSMLFMLMLIGLSTSLSAETLLPQSGSPPPGPGVVKPPPAIPAELLDRNRIQVSPPERVSTGVYKIGDIIINKTERSVSFPAVVNMNTGLLEYLLVKVGGKTHESLFRTSIEPYNLQIACLLLDFTGTDKPLAFQGAPELPKGDSIDIEIKVVSKDGTTQRVNPKDWLVKSINGEKSDIGELRWIFTGSLVLNGQFASQVEGSIIALYHDPAAIVDNASPGGESDKIWFVREDAVPAVGTPVTLTIKAKK